VSDLSADELARAAATDTVQLTQRELPTGRVRGGAAVWHDRGVAVKRELAGRAEERGSEAAAEELWNEAESSQAVSGEEADELRRVVLGLLRETKRIVIVLAWIGHIDSSGLGTLVASFISARHHGAEIKFAALSPVARRALQITKVDRLFEIYDSAEEAIRSFHLDSEAAAG